MADFEMSYTESELASMSPREFHILQREIRRGNQTATWTRHSEGHMVLEVRDRETYTIENGNGDIVGVIPMLDNDRYIKTAKKLVFDDVIASGELRSSISPDDFYVVWFCKTLQNWKALVSSDVVNGRYWEVTFDGDKSRAYVDLYIKVHNTPVEF